MKLQTTIGKSFEINQDAQIYGSFAEIGAGQETVNYFFKAGLASQTIAKSMSAYDMTFSDEIYGKQSRYVCKDRLVTMLNHEYRLLEKRLKTRQKNTKFFAFATTAVTSSKSRANKNQSTHHAWMGLRFQSKPSAPFNEITFHVNCLDKNRLQQHESLGVLGVNLIYAAFHYNKNPKKFFSSLLENLSTSRIEINSVHCSGPQKNLFSNASINKICLEQKLSKLSFFSSSNESSFIGDTLFNKTATVIYGDKPFLQYAQKQPLLKKTFPQSVFISSYFEKDFKNKSRLKQDIDSICKKNFNLLMTPQLNLTSLSHLLKLYTSKPIHFIISENYFKKSLFYNESNTSLLSLLGSLFDKNTKVFVLSKNKNFSIKDFKLKNKEDQLLKDYLISKKKLLSL